MNTSDVVSLRSSFFKRVLSKDDAIIQILRPQLGGRITTALDVFDRMVTEAETLTQCGVVLQTGVNNGERFHITPIDLEANLDEYSELIRLATLGRKFLLEMGYEPLRKVTVPPGFAPVGKSVDAQAFTMQLPGSEPLAGTILSPKKPDAT